MTHTITLPDQTTFTANEDETVLAAATRQNFKFASFLQKWCLRAV